MEQSQVQVILINALITIAITIMSYFLGWRKFLWETRRKYMLETIIKFKHEPGKALSNASLVFNHSAEVMGALQRYYYIFESGIGDSQKYLQYAIEAMYDEAKLDYSTFPALARFQDVDD